MIDEETGVGSGESPLPQVTVRASPEVLEGQGDPGLLAVSAAKLGTNGTSTYHAHTNRFRPKPKHTEMS